MSYDNVKETDYCRDCQHNDICKYRASYTDFCGRYNALYTTYGDNQIIEKENPKCKYYNPRPVLFSKTADVLPNYTV